MTVSTTNITSGPYAGNDLATEFVYDFRVTDSSELRVFETDDLGVQTELTLTTHYTVSGIGDNSGGIITRVAGALPTGYTWYIRSNYQATQGTDFNSQGGFFPDVHEAAFDKLTFLHQQQTDQIARSLRLSDGDASAEGADLSLPILADLKGTVLAFNESTGYPEAGPTLAAVGTVTANVANINTVATNIADVSTVAAGIADVTAVAADLADVTTVAADSVNIGLVAADLTNIDAVAADLAEVNNFAGVYQGAFASDPAARTIGGALVAGDLYTNTSLGEIRTYTGSTWVAAAASPILNALSYQGGWDATTTLPAADAGHYLKVTVASAAPIAFANGIQDVQTFDALICNTDGTAANTPGNWDVIQGNFEIATQAEAEAGTEATKVMTAQRVEQHFQAKNVFHGVLSYLATNISITTATPTPLTGVTWTDETDTGSVFADGEFVPPNDSKPWLVAVTATVDNVDAGSDYRVDLYRNGGLLRKLCWGNGAASASATTASGSCIVVGDGATYTVYVYQSTVGARNALAGSTNTFFHAHKLVV